MKAILVVDVPNDADLTKLIANINIEKVRDCGYDYEPYTFRLYCPLRPLPQKDKYNDDNFVVFETKDEIKSILLGENVNRVRAQVIDEILGEEE